MLHGDIKNEITDLFASNGRGLELEARFGTFERDGRFYSGVSRSVFNRVKAYFDEKASSVNTLTTDYIMGNVRKTVDVKTQDVTWMTKQRLWNRENKDYGIRYSMSREVPSNPISDTIFKADVIREKNRTSYLVFNNSVRIDITYVSMISGPKKSKDDITFEIEIELIDYTKLDNFEKAVLVTLKLVQDTLFPYTQKEKDNIINETNIILGSSKRGYFDSYPLVQARNLKLRDMVWGGLIGNKDTGYTVTHKTDGIRKLLVFSKNGVWLCAPNSLTKVLDKEIPTLTGTILDGEMVPREKRLNNIVTSNIWFLVFDTLAWNGDKDVQNKPHAERMMYGQTVADNVKNNLITITTKTFKSFDTPIKFFEVMREMFREQLHLSYLQDGFMFTPANSVYNPHSDKNPIYKRTLTVYPDICKWKPKEELTIDFLIKWGISGTNKTIELYSQERGDLKKFNGTKIYPFDNKNIDITHELLDNLPTNTVVEFGYDYSRNILVPRRVRHDKAAPNSKDVAEDVWSDIQTPIDAEDLKGNTFTLLRKYHNSIKKKLFSMATEKKGNENKGKYLLDIGSGYGGDLGKWGAFEKIVAVEPDPEHIAELEKRLDSYGMRNKVKVVQAGGQETEKITEAVKEWIGGRVDVVSSMLSLTFFWQSSSLVDSLVNTIISNIKDNGVYIFLTMDGDLVEQTFNPASNTGLPLKKLKLGPATLEYFSDKTPQELYIDIEGTIVEKQREWLVRLDDLMLRMGKYGFDLEVVHRADEEKFLTEEEIIMTQMYTYGMFSRVSTNVPLPEKTKSPSTKIELPSVSPTKIELPSVSPTKIELPPVSELSKLPLNVPPLPPSKVSPPVTPSKVSPPPLPPSKLPPPPLSAKIAEPVEKQLPSLAMGKVEDIKVKWWDEPIVRIATIGNGDCFIHGVFTGYLRIYQTSNDNNFRINFVRKFRNELADSLTSPDEVDPSKTKYETASGGVFVEMRKMQEEGLNFKDVLGQTVDFSLEGLIKLFRSNEFLGDEVYSYVADILGIDIYVMRLTDKDLYPHLNTSKSDDNRKAVVISGNGQHFETIGILRDGLYQTFFEPTDPFIKKIKSFSKE